jgi:hypothetical protein
MAARFITELKRTHTCCELTAADVGKTVVLYGWVHTRATTAARCSSTCATATA